MTFEVSGLVIARDEATDLPACLDRLTALCERVVVVDNESTDETAAIARTYGARVIPQSMDNEGFAGLRNAGLDRIETSHVLILDADERPTPALMASLRGVISREAGDAAYRLERRTNVLGGWLDHGRFKGDAQIRLFSSSVRYVGTVHEQPVLPESTEIIDLTGKLEHFTYASLREYLSKARRYAAMAAQAGQELPSYQRIVGMPFYNFIRRQGYKDGWRGVLTASIDGWHDYLLRGYTQALTSDCRRSQ